MTNFFVGLLTVFALFALCNLVAYIICVFNEKYAKEKASPESDAKVYYITNFEKPKKPRKRKKTPNVALKGTVISPEQFHKVFYDSKNSGGFDN